MFFHAYINNKFFLQVLILATGFKFQEFFGPLKILGEEEADILKSWTENGPNNYLGFCTKSAKNLFFIYGAQSVSNLSNSGHLTMH